MLPLMYNPTATDIEEKARAALERVGLGDRMDHKPNELSGGQQQRVAVARALVNNPALILGDEPTGNLDTRTSEEIMALFQDLHAEGKTVVLVTHEEDIAHHAQRIIRFRDGHIVSDQQVDNRARRTRAARQAARGGRAMNLRESIEVALEGLVANKMRAVLTMLGVIIGVGRGDRDARDGHGRPRTDNAAHPADGHEHAHGDGGAVQAGRGPDGIRQQHDSYTRRLHAIAEKCPSVSATAPEVRGNTQVKYGNQNTNTTIFGTTPDYLPIRDYSVAQGKFFSEQDVKGSKKVCDIGPTTAENLFGERLAGRQVIRMGGSRYKVIGLMTAKGSGSGFSDPDDQIFIPGLHRHAPRARRYQHPRHQRAGQIRRAYGSGHQ